MGRITINGITIDPVLQSLELQTLSLEFLNASLSNYLLIQTNGPIRASQRNQLLEIGVVIQSKVPENTLMGRFAGTDLSSIRELPFVIWANPYLKVFKIAPELIDLPNNTNLSTLTAAVDQEVSMGDGGQLIDIVLHDDINPPEIRGLISLAAGVDSEFIDTSRHKFRLHIDKSRLGRLASFDEVHHMEPAPEAELFNDVAANIMRADIVHSGRASQYRGAGQTIAVCDTGFDKGSTTDVHPAFLNRVKKLYPLGRTRANDPNGHGTHVAGSALGHGIDSDQVEVTGTAPDSMLVLQSVLDSAGKLSGLPSDLNQLFAEPYNNDQARIHNNSWGSTNTRGNYTQSSKEVDEFVWNNRDMVICFAAGNPGRDANSNGVIDMGSVQAPSTAKNCVTVGASESDRPHQSKIWGTGSWANRYPAEPIRSDLWADNPDGMAAFSGRGPTKDGRIKPDLVAPGTSILSAHSRDASVGAFWGTSNDPDYTYMGGTSMATPLVAGCAALMREFLVQSMGIATPSAALVKAALINGCVNLPGQYTPSETGILPNLNSGFGRVDIASAIQTSVNGTLSFYNEAGALDTGEESAFSVTILSGQELKVTLVWTDPPGEGLQNDLDLIVTASDGEIRHGNMPANSTKFDRKNNVEQVIWSSCPPGIATIVIRAYDISMHQQPFALVVRVD